MKAWRGRVGLMLMIVAGTGCSAATSAEDGDYEAGLEQEHVSDALEAAESPRVNWWQSGRTQRNTSLNPFETTLSVATVPGLHEIWKYTIPYATQSWADGELSLLNGQLYSSRLRAADYTGEEFALNEDTGAVIWRALGAPGRGRRHVGVASNGRVYVKEGQANDNDSDNKYLFALRASNGQPIPWTRQPRVDGEEFYGSSFTAAGRGVFQTSIQSTENGTCFLARMSVDTGLYSGMVYDCYSEARPIVADGRVFVPGSPSYQSFDAETLAPIPRTDAPDEPFFAPMIAFGGFLYGLEYDEAGDGSVASINIRTGKRAWSTATLGISLATVSDDSVFVATRSFGNQPAGLSRFDRRTGSLLYSTVLPASAATLSNANGVLYLRTSSGALLAIDGSNGQVLTTVAGGFTGEPIVANGRVYVSTTNAIIALGVD